MSAQSLGLHKESALRDQARVERLDVYAARLVTDDGVKFFVAKSQYQARKIAMSDCDIASGAQVRKAKVAELQSIAVRALEGM